MNVLWRHGELKPAEIQEVFETPIKNSALRALLTVLLEKGHVQRRLVGKAYFYKAKTRRAVTMRRSLRQVVDVFFDGSTEALIVNLIKSQKLSDEDLVQLRRVAESGGMKKSVEDKTRKTKESKGNSEDRA